MPNLIKKPPPDEMLKLRVTNDLRHKYLASVIQTRSHWEGFQRTANESMTALNLSLERYTHEQDPEVWKRFCDNVCRRRTFLRDYEDAWPLEALFNSKAYRHRIRIGLELASSHSGRDKQKRRLDKERQRSPNPLPPDRRALHKRSESVIIERFSPYPKAAAPSRSKNPVSHCIDPTSPQPGSRSFPIAVESTPAPSFGLLGLSEGSQVSFTSSQATLVDTPNPFSQVERTEIASPDEVFVGCCECGHLLPPHLSGPNTRLIDFLANESKDMVECLRALREGGLTSDAHLRVFLAWPVPCKKAFIDDLDTRKQVKRSLRELVHASIPVQTYGSTQGASTEPHRKIPQPIDDSAEDVLTDPQQPLEFLLKAMDLPNNRGPFQEIVAAVKEGADVYITTYRPSKGLFEAAVKDITGKGFRLFERYENQWPARVILKRFARECKVKALDDHLSPLVSTPTCQASSSSFESQYPQGNSSSSFAGSSKAPSTSRSPGILPNISYTCPIHPGPDQDFVAPVVRRLLHSRGLAELIPVFALMSIPTEEDFKGFCALSVGKKDEAVNATELRLTSFQRLALKLDLWEGVLEESVA